jgi:putative salt-induced outer membrane protein YdiY
MNHRMRVSSLIVALAAGALAAPAMAELVTLKSGEMIQATVVSKDDANVVVDHPILGKLTIPAAQVQSIAPSEPATPEGKVVEARPAGAPAPVAEPKKDEIPAKPPSQGRFIDDWDAKFEAGFSGSSGNTKNLSYHVGFEAKKETESDRWKFDVGYFRESTDGEATRNDFTEGLLKDWLFKDSKWFWWADERYDYDDFKSWKQRFAAHTGPGYTFLDDEKFKLFGRVGAGARKEWGSEEDDVIPEGFASIDFTWKINEQQSFNATATYYPELNDSGDFRTLETLGWTCKMTEKGGLALKLGISHEYESQVDDDSVKNDVKYFGAIVFSF